MRSPLRGLPTTANFVVDDPEAATMRDPSQSITWHGQAFHFERMHPMVSSSEIAVWAVSRRGEFIGTMPCALEVTTKEFETRSIRWLRDLLGASV